MKRLFLFFLFLPLAAAAQQTCGTEYMYQQMLKKNPGIAKIRAAGDQHALEYQLKKHAGQTSTAIRVIPVVVHIIHNYGPENISKAQVLDAIKILNEDFQKMNADTNQVIAQFKQIIGNPQVEFRLANKDPNGNCTDGITRTVSALTFNADENVKDLISWDNSKYYNIWVVSKISFGAGGYAFYPGSAQAGHEGVVVINSQFGGIGMSIGSNFARRTLTHETGHWLNLAHTWGSSNSCGDPNNCSIDDGVTDTPNTIGNCITCNLNVQNCGSLDNVQNYMDYAACTKMFTQGQVNRMDAALNSGAGYRLQLWQTSNLIATGTSSSSQNTCIPVSDFISNINNICEGASVTFTDLSWNGTASTWSWSFPGGTPSFSSAASPVVQYNSAGMYSVSLTASNTAGTGNTATKTAYIIVRSDTANYSSWHYIEGFEGKPIPNTDWAVVNPDNGSTWYQTNAASSSGFKSARIDNLSNTADEVDELISPSVDLSQISNPMLYFRVAYAPVNTGDNDKLAVYISLDCGHTWQIKYLKKGSALATAGNQSSNFVPNAGQWSQESLNLAPYASYTRVLFKFSFTYAGGNNIYLDDINIGPPVGTEEGGEGDFLFRVFPNPAVAEAKASFFLAKASPVKFSLEDVLGRQLLVIDKGILNAGEHQVSIGKEPAIKPGVYFLRMEAGAHTRTEKILFR